MEVSNESHPSKESNNSIESKEIRDSHPSNESNEPSGSHSPLPSRSVGVASAEDEAWARQLDAGTAQLLAELGATTVERMLSEESPLETRERETRAAAREAFVQKNIVVPERKGGNETEARLETRQCRLCLKNFQNADYVRKHILNKHAEQMKVAENKTVLLEVVRADYIKNPKARIPNVTPLKIISRASAAVQETVQTEDLQKLVGYGRQTGWISRAARKYVDRDSVGGLELRPKKKVDEVFNDDF